MSEKGWPGTYGEEVQLHPVHFCGAAKPAFRPEFIGVHAEDGFVVVGNPRVHPNNSLRFVENMSACSQVERNASRSQPVEEGERTPSGK